MWKNSELSASAAAVASSVDVAVVRWNNVALHNIDRVIAVSNFATVNLTIVFMMCRDKIERVFLPKMEVTREGNNFVSAQLKRPKLWRF